MIIFYSFSYGIISSTSSVFQTFVHTKLFFQVVQVLSDACVALISFFKTIFPTAGRIIFKEGQFGPIFSLYIP